MGAAVLGVFFRNDDVGHFGVTSFDRQFHIRYSNTLAFGYVLCKYHTQICLFRLSLSVEVCRL